MKPWTDEEVQSIRAVMEDKVWDSFLAEYDLRPSFIERVTDELWRRGYKGVTVVPNSPSTDRESFRVNYPERDGYIVVNIYLEQNEWYIPTE